MAGKKKSGKKKNKAGAGSAVFSLSLEASPEFNAGSGAGIKDNTFALTHTGKPCINPAECPSDITSAEGQAATMSVVSMQHFMQHGYCV